MTRSPCPAYCPSSIRHSSQLLPCCCLEASSLLCGSTSYFSDGLPLIDGRRKRILPSGVVCVSQNYKVLKRMAMSTSKDAQDLFHALWSAYSASPINLKIIDLYVVFAIFTAFIQVVRDKRTGKTKGVMGL